MTKKNDGLNEDNKIVATTNNINAGGHKELVPEGTNTFGGKNPLGQYVPMSEDEQEVLTRIAESDDIELVVHEWGVIPNPKLVVGDHRIRIDFRITFKGLHIARPLHYLDLELRLGNGMSVYRDRKPTYYNHAPIDIYEGMYLDFMWDIAIDHLDPQFVRAIKPGATGLTSRRQDKDTGEMTSRGNMKLDVGQQRILQELEASQARIRKVNEQEAIKASVEGGANIKKTADGVAYSVKQG